MPPKRKDTPGSSSSKRRLTILDYKKDSKKAKSEDPPSPTTPEEQVLLSNEPLPVFPILPDEAALMGNDTPPTTPGLENPVTFVFEAGATQVPAAPEVAPEVAAVPNSETQDPTAEIPATETAPNTASQELTAETEIPPQPTFRGVIFLKSLGPLNQQSIDDIRCTLLLGVMEKQDTIALDLGVVANSLDIKGNKLVIRTTNYETILMAKDILEGSTYSCVDDESLPGIRVRLFFPKWVKPIIDRGMLMRCILIHHRSLKEGDISIYQPYKEVNGGYIAYCTLSYTAQIYFYEREWKILLLGLTVSICALNAPKGTKPVMETDRSPPEINTLSSMAIN